MMVSNILLWNIHLRCYRLKGQYRHNQSRLLTEHGIDVLVQARWLHSDWKLLAHLWNSNGNLWPYHVGIIFSHWVNLKKETTKSTLIPCPVDRDDTAPIISEIISVIHIGMNVNTLNVCSLFSQHNPSYSQYPSFMVLRVQSIQGLNKIKLPYIDSYMLWKYLFIFGYKFILALKQQCICMVLLICNIHNKWDKLLNILLYKRNMLDHEPLQGSPQPPKPTEKSWLNNAT